MRQFTIKISRLKTWPVIVWEDFAKYTIQTNASDKEILEAKKQIERLLNVTFEDFVSALQDFEIPKTWLSVLKEMNFSAFKSIQYKATNESSYWFELDNVGLNCTEVCKVFIELFNYTMDIHKFEIVEENDIIDFTSNLT